MTLSLYVIYFSGLNLLLEFSNGALLLCPWLFRPSDNVWRSRCADAPRCALFCCYLTFLDHRTNISRKVLAPRRVSASGASNNVKNCHLEKTSMDKTAQNLFINKFLVKPTALRYSQLIGWQNLLIEQTIFQSELAPCIADSACSKSQLQQSRQRWFLLPLIEGIQRLHQRFKSEIFLPHDIL